MQQNEFNNAQRKLHPAIISLIVIVIIAVAAAAVYAAMPGDTEPAEPAKTTTPTEEATDADDVVTPRASSDYKNGTYTASGSYMTLGGTEHVTVEAVLENGIIVDVDTTGSATGGNSAQYQRQFLAGYESHVVGKSIDEVSLSRVSGSSLTSTGFNAALEEIKRDARA